MEYNMAEVTQHVRMWGEIGGIKLQKEQEQAVIALLTFGRYFFFAAVAHAKL